MPIHSILLLTLSPPSVVFARYFDRSSLQAQEAFESDLVGNAETYLSRGGSGGSSSEALFCVTVGAGVQVVFQRLGQLVLYVGGTDEMDEIVLADVVACIRGVIFSLVGQRPEGDGGSDGSGSSSGGSSSGGGGNSSSFPSDQDVLQSAVFSALSLAVDELVAGAGHLDSTDVEGLLLRAKLKV